MKNEQDLLHSISCHYGYDAYETDKNGLTAYAKELRAKKTLIKRAMIELLPKDLKLKWNKDTQLCRTVNLWVSEDSGIFRANVFPFNGRYHWSICTFRYVCKGDCSKLSSAKRAAERAIRNTLASFIADQRVKSFGPTNN